MKHTEEVFKRLSKGQFISANSPDTHTRAVFMDMTDNFEEYRGFFLQIGFILNNGNNYFYFSRNENKTIIRNKLERMLPWIDSLAFLKAYDSTFGPGTRFRVSDMEARAVSDIELGGRLSSMYREQKTVREKIDALVEELLDRGFAETVNQAEGLYMVASAYDYIEKLICSITIKDEDHEETE